MGAGGRHTTKDITVYNPDARVFVIADYEYKVMAANRKVNALLYDKYTPVIDEAKAVLPKVDKNNAPGSDHFDMALYLFETLPALSLEGILDMLDIPVRMWNVWRHKNPTYNEMHTQAKLNKSNRNEDASHMLIDVTISGFPSSELVKLVDTKVKLLMKQSEQWDNSKKANAVAVQVNNTNNINTQPVIEVRDMTDGKTYILNE